MSSDIGTTVLAATQGMTAFWQFMPRITDVRKSDLSDADMRGDVRYGEIAAAGVTIGTGAILWGITKSTMPLMVSILVTAGFICLYEGALRGNRPMDSLPFVKGLTNAE